MMFIRLITIVLLLLGSVLDTLLTLRCLFLKTICLTNFTFIHALIIGVIYIFVEIWDKDNTNIPFIIAFFLPGIGTSFLFFVYVALVLINYKNSLIEDYHQYTEYISEMISTHKLDVEKELNVLPALDILKFSDDERKKNVIIDLISDDIDLKIHILKRALKDEDPEVVHYASSILNLVEEEYEKKINELRDQYITIGSEKVLQQLIHVYGNYLDSGLVNEALLKFELNEYMDIINQYIHIFENRYDIWIKKADILIKLNHNKEALDLLQWIIKQYPDEYKPYVYRLKALYNMNENNEMIMAAQEMKRLNINIPDKYKEMVQFWT